MKTCRHTTRRRRLIASASASASATVALFAIALTGPALAKKPRGALAPGASSPARKAPAKPTIDSQGCAAAYTQAQDKAQAAHLREAKELLAKCAKAVCGNFLQKECGTLYTLLGADIPSIVPLVTDDAGQPIVLVEVRMDGELLTSRLDGRALPVDPGNHEFTFSTDAGVFATRKVILMQGQRNRTVSVKLKRGANTSRVPPPPPQSSTASTK